MYMHSVRLIRLHDQSYHPLRAYEEVCWHAKSKWQHCSRSIHIYTHHIVSYPERSNEIESEILTISKVIQLESSLHRLYTHRNSSRANGELWVLLCQSPQYSSGVASSQPWHHQPSLISARCTILSLFVARQL